MGHIIAVPEDGELCKCGRTGCLVTIASATGIVRIAKEKEKVDSLLRNNETELNISSKDIFEAASLG
ncbi:ROK family protein [Halalkalibacter sp. APA_J-10(15)]|uniref:ROK family protein n=1 Tax=Halalkalibacter sp. APA_J-10(15) TaxID=2933805 RepID=UPI0034D502AA